MTYFQRFLLLIPIFLISTTGLVLSSYTDIKFHHITVQDGLSQNTVNCSFQDSRRFMWFGTQDGLNRYDGYEFLVYRNDPDDQESLQANWIWSIGEDSKGNIWVGTFGGGLSCFNRLTEKFTTFLNDPDDSLSLSHDTVWDFLEYPEGTFWVATNNGLNRMTLLQSDSLQAQFEYIPIDTIQTNIFKIVHAEGQNLWLTGPSGLYRFNIENYEYTHFGLLKNVQNFGRLSGTYGQSGNLWINSPGNGIFKFDLKTEIVKHYFHDPANPQNSIYNNYAISVCEDQQGVVWVGMTSKLSLIFPDGKIQHLNYDPADLNSLSHDFITNIYESSDGTIWIGTRSGVDIYNRFAQKFIHKKYKPDTKKSFTSPNIICFLEDSDGDFWIGTNNGLNHLNKKTQLYTHYFTNDSQPEKGPLSNYILYLMEDSNRNIWVGTRNGGVSIWQRESDTFRHFGSEAPASFKTGVVISIFEDSNNNIWIGMNGAGLYFYNHKNRNILKIPSDTSNPQDKMNDISVFALFEDKKGIIYAGTAAGGINIIDRKTFKAKHLLNKKGDKTSLSNNRVICFAETREGEIWVGTAQGLNKMKINAQGSYYFKQYHVKDGLPNEVIYSIIEDADGYLWISTNNGIAKINTKNTFDVKVFYADDGLQGNEFNQNAWYKDSKGLIYFGGNNGYNIFDPARLSLNQQPPEVHITHFRIIDKEVLPAKDGILHKTISETKNITLPWQDNVFSFEFAALNFIMPERIEYAYKMEGFDKDWTYIGPRRFTTYTNLDAGTYIFRVKASNNDGVWNNAGASIQIKVLPPPWKTWWAYVIYGLVATASIFGFLRFKAQQRDKEIETFARIEQAKSEERAHVRKKVSADFHDEAGNLITKIILFTELSKRSLTDPKQIKPYLDKIEENSKQLSGGMRDFIWALDPEKDTLRDTLYRIESFGNSMFEYSDINFTAQGIQDSPDSINLAIDDRRSLVLIFKEVMNNCLKYSQAKNARLKVKRTNGELIISFTDDGQGFPAKSQKEGYGLTNIQTRAKKMGAILKIDSNPGKGVTIEYYKKII